MRIILPQPQELRSLLTYLKPVLTMKPESTTVFATDRDSLAKSFAFAPLLAVLTLIWPVFPPEYVGVSPFINALAAVLLYSMTWTLFPVVLYQIGYRDRFRAFLVVNNWLLVFSLILSFAFQILSFLSFLAVPVNIYFLVVQWFIMRDALKISGGKAFSLLLLSIVLMMLVVSAFLVGVEFDLQEFTQDLNRAANA